MIGWAAVTGGVDLQSIVLFAMIFVWTPPHFWALALYRQIDYAKAKVPMLPVVAGRAATKRQILLYSVLLAPLGVLPALLGTAGAVYGLVAAAMGALLRAAGAAGCCGTKATVPAKQLFGYLDPLSLRAVRPSHHRPGAGPSGAEPALADSAGQLLASSGIAG